MTARQEPLKWRKKPVVVQAVQFDGTLASIEALNIPEASQDLGSRTLQIHTLEGVMTAQPGDWIIRGVQGEFYPCKPDIFEATYEPADTPERNDAAELRAAAEDALVAIGRQQRDPAYHSAYLLLQRAARRLRAALAATEGQP
jgi:hypothetical protein